MTVGLDHFLADVGDDRRAAIEARANELIAEHQTLAALRKERGLTQAQVAHAMETSQANIAQIERKADTLVSTVARVVRAMGGRLRLTAEFNDGPSVVLSIGHDGEISSRNAGDISATAAAPRCRRPASRKAYQAARNASYYPLVERLAQVASASNHNFLARELTLAAGRYDSIDLMPSAPSTPSAAYLDDKTKENRKLVSRLTHEAFF